MGKTALVTGATSGLGLEAAAQLVAKAYDRIVITGRTEAKAEAARATLASRTGSDVFETLVLDLDSLDSVAQAADELKRRGGAIDFLLLNAGVAPGKDLAMTADGLEATVASSLIGHHLVTMRMLEDDLIAKNGRIVLAGSEAARGDVPMFSVIDIHELASQTGDLESAIEAQFRIEAPAKYVPGDQYATTKLFSVWWAGELANRLPAGTTVNVVSPGSTPATNAAKNAPFLMKNLLIPIFKLIPGMSHDIGDGAGRYLEAADFGADVNGKFFASAPKKMTGPLHEMGMSHLEDPEAARALWNVVTKVAGGVGYPSVN